MKLLPVVFLETNDSSLASVVKVAVREAKEREQCVVFEIKGSFVPVFPRESEEVVKYRYKSSETCLPPSACRKLD